MRRGYTTKEEESRIRNCSRKIAGEKTEQRFSETQSRGETI